MKKVSKLVAFILSGVCLMGTSLSAVEVKDSIIHNISGNPDKDNHLKIEYGFENTTGALANLYAEDWLTFGKGNFVKLAENIEPNERFVRTENVYVIPAYVAAESNITPPGDLGEGRVYDPELMYFDTSGGTKVETGAYMKVNTEGDGTNLYEGNHYDSYDISNYIAKTKILADTFKATAVFPKTVTDFADKGVHYMLTNTSDVDMTVTVEDWGAYGVGVQHPLTTVPAGEQVFVQVPVAQILGSNKIIDEQTGVYLSYSTFHVYTGDTKIDNTTQIPTFVYKDIIKLSEPPVLELTNETVELESGTSFSARDYVKLSKDTLLGDTTSSISIDDSALDMNTPGEYPVKYTLVGKFGYSTETTLMVKVVAATTEETNNNNNGNGNSGSGSGTINNVTSTNQSATQSSSQGDKLTNTGNPIRELLLFAIVLLLSGIASLGIYLKKQKYNHR